MVSPFPRTMGALPTLGGFVSSGMMGDSGMVTKETALQCVKALRSAGWQPPPQLIAIEVAAEAAIAAAQAAQMAAAAHGGHGGMAGSKHGRAAQAAALAALGTPAMAMDMANGAPARSKKSKTSHNGGANPAAAPAPAAAAAAAVGMYNLHSVYQQLGEAPGFTLPTTCKRLVSTLKSIQVEELVSSLCFQNSTCTATLRRRRWRLRRRWLTTRTPWPASC
jgi:hypothetical protein